jgi:hypothetical protein
VAVNLGPYWVVPVLEVLLRSCLPEMEFGLRAGLEVVCLSGD